MSLDKEVVGKTLYDLFFSHLRKSPELVQKVDQAGVSKSPIDLVNAVGDMQENEGATRTILNIAKALGLNLDDYETQVIDGVATDVDPPKLSE